MFIPKNSWHCSLCNFYVFNSKTRCNKCFTQKPESKPLFTSYDPEFDKKVCEYYKQSYLESETTCTRCRSEGRIFNKENMKSNHNCWKYS